MERVVRDVVAVFQTGRFVAGVIQMAGDRQVEPVFYIAADTGTDIGCFEPVSVLFVYCLLYTSDAADEL